MWRKLVRKLGLKESSWMIEFEGLKALSEVRNAEGFVWRRAHPSHRGLGALPLK